MNLLTLKDWSKRDVNDVILRSIKIKKKKYSDRLKGKTLLMIFAKPSLRTRVSFEVAMNRLGGHAIVYDLSHATLGKKESMKDFSKVVSRYADVVMARLYQHSEIEALARYSDVPVINGLTNSYHPCQIVADLMTMREKLGHLHGKKIAFLGDCNNNVTHSLIIGAEKVGMDIVISCPDKDKYLPDRKSIGDAKWKYEVDPELAVKDADVIYTDSWMSYHVAKSEEKSRIKELSKYRVDKKLFDVNKKSIFMHCLPAKRGQEVTDEVMDSKRSVVYQQAENRMWSEMAILLKCLGVRA